ncbi:hypothetical protein WG66_002271 [Moniliophthora roreri]|nr:hypothetical protein WG66_002271 [Moniliophthora roreri]
MASNQDSLLHFPTDIIDVIMELSSKSSLISLCLVCKALKEAATRVLYHTLLLKKPSKLVQCLRTLLQNPLAAASCRIFCIKYPIEIVPRKATHLGAFFGLLAKVLPRIFNLRNISITISHQHEAGLPLTKRVDFILQNCTYPHLKQAFMKMPITPAVIQFLERHQKTVELVVLLPYGDQFAMTFDRAYYFPRLEHFYANATSALSFFKSLPFDALPGLRQLTIYWMPLEIVDLRVLMTVMKKKCRDQEVKLAFFRIGRNDDNDLIEEVSLQFPHVNELSVCSYGNEDWQETCQAVAQSLSRCTTLSSFWWTVKLSETDAPRRMLDLEEELSIIISFGAACPSLHHCRVPYGISWINTRNIKNLWVPCENARDELSAYPFLFYLIHRRKYPPLAELLNYIEGDGEVERRERGEEGSNYKSDGSWSRIWAVELLRAQGSSSGAPPPEGNSNHA